MKKMRNNYTACILLITLFALSGCRQLKKNMDEKQALGNPAFTGTKPPSAYRDTLIVPSPAAIFFEPDSIQLAKIKSVTDQQVFNGSTHECFYQVKNATKFLGEHWPDLKIIRANKWRFLLFGTRDRVVAIVDLDKQDPCGLFVFDGLNGPQLLDMTNIETQVPGYFSKNRSKEGHL